MPSAGARGTMHSGMRLPGTREQRAEWLRRGHAVLAVAWAVMLPVALVTGWVYSLVFISACSLYANAAAHFGGWQGGRAERAANDDD